MNDQQRQQEVQQFISTVDWDTYDYTKAKNADMSFPDFSPEELQAKGPWLPKHYNKTSRWNTCHVPDLNQMSDGHERRLFALYGIPAQWPNKRKNESEWLAVIRTLDAAHKVGGQKWAQALDHHGLLNDEHYEWIRHYHLEHPKHLTTYEQAVKVIGEIDGALAGGNADSLLAQNSFFDERHFHHYKAFVERQKNKAWAGHNKKLDEINNQLEQKFQENKAALSGELAPFQGVSLEDWAAANVKIMNATPLDKILSVLGISKDVWDQVNAEWNKRMANDKTMTVATVYGQAFTGAVQGRFAGKN